MNRLDRSVLTARRYVRDLVLNRWISSSLLPRPLRWRALRWCGLDIAPSAISSGCFWGGRSVSIGNGSFVNHGCVFDAAGPIRIGQHCQIGMQVMLCTGTHELGPTDKRGGTPRAVGVVVGDGVWIGTRAVVLPGVTIGNGCVIAAGAVVVRDCAPDGVYAGVPARLVRQLS